MEQDNTIWNKITQYANKNVIYIKNAILKLNLTNTINIKKNKTKCWRRNNIKIYVITVY